MNEKTNQQTYKPQIKVTVNDGPANLYTGVVPETDFSGMVLLVKIRDKTAVLRTDSMLFESDFRKLMDTIKFNT